MNLAPLPGRGYRLVLADPPWKFETWSADGGNRAAARHYHVMSDAAICALGNRIALAEHCAPDCWLVLWSTWNKLVTGVAAAVADSWGFSPVAGGCWDKQRMGTGYILRDECEPFIVAKRGTPKVVSRDVGNMIRIARREHSRKPDEMYAKVERAFDGPYLELFARARRSNWHAWGNEVGKFGGGI